MYIIRGIQRKCVCLYKLSLDLKKKLVYLFCLIEVYFGGNESMRVSKKLI